MKIKLPNTESVEYTRSWLEVNVGTTINWLPYDACTFIGQGWRIFAEIIKTPDRDYSYAVWQVEIEDSVAGIELQKHLDEQYNLHNSSN